jgi:mRNA-degrading endonuclease toxin of MazEF toxin-antitoxin module
VQVDDHDDVGRVGKHRSPSGPQLRAASFRPQIAIGDDATKVLVEQVGGVDTTRFGALAGHVTAGESWGIDEALLTVLGLR